MTWLPASKIPLSVQETPGTTKQVHLLGMQGQHMKASTILQTMKEQSETEFKTQYHLQELQKVRYLLWI